MSTFLQVVELLLTSDDAKAAYADDPSTFLDTHGLGALDADDLTDAMQYVNDSLPAPVAVLLDPSSGLDSAAQLDLEAQGLSLEREPIEAIDVTGDLFGSDVDFDTPDNDAIGDDIVDAFDNIEANDGETAIPEDDDPSALAVDAPAEDAGIDQLSATEDDGLTDPLELTATLLEDPHNEAVDEPLETVDLDQHHELSDLTDDLPDDFDLLD